MAGAAREAENSKNFEICIDSTFFKKKMDEVDLGFNGKLKIFYCSNKSPVKLKEFSRQQGQKFLRRKNVIYKSILRVIRFFTCGQIFLVFHISKICEEELITFGP
jgi:hypothetical protein